MSATTKQHRPAIATDDSVSVPPGFKHTEVGVIPEDWHAGMLSEVISDLLAGVSVNSTTGDLDHSVPAILKTSCVESGAFLSNEAKIIAPKERHRAKLNPRRDTILISRMNTIELVGECGFVNQDYPELFVPDRLWMTQARSPSSVSIRWLAAVLSSAQYRRQLQLIATGTSGSMKNIAKSSLLSLKIAYPPPPEQRAIAEALSDVDGLLGALEALIAKKRAIKQGAMQQLLTGKTRLPGFSGEWDSEQLPQVTTIRKGDLITASSLTPGSVPVIAGGMAPAYFHAWANRSHPCVTVSASGASAGYVAYHRSPIFASDCSTVEGTSKVSTEFAFHWLSSNQQNVYGLQSGGAQPHVQPKDLARLSISFPVLEEQRAITTVLSDMDAEIAALEARRDKTRAIKQGMMQQLLTGRVRLVKPVETA